MTVQQKKRPSSPTSRLLRAVAAASLALFAVPGPRPVLAQAAKPAPAAAPVVKLNTVVVRRGDIQQTVDAAGKLQLYKWADTYAQIGGQVKEVMVAVGDRVKVDQALVEITPALQPTKVESNRAQMARMQADLADQQAQREFASCSSSARPS